MSDKPRGTSLTRAAKPASGQNSYRNTNENNVVSELGTRHDDRNQQTGLNPSQAAPPNVPVGGQDLNFGWFSMPGARRANAASGREPMNTDSAVGSPGLRNQTSSLQPPGSRCGRQSAAPAANVQVPPSRGGVQHPGQMGFMTPQHPETAPTLDSQGQGSQEGEANRMVVDYSQCDLGHGEGQCKPREPCQGPQPGEASNDPQYPEERVVVDWPMSRTALEAMMRAQSAPRRQFGSEKQPRPGSRACQIPPTPMPPLSWDGYGSTTRPTFASWHDEWHGSHNCKHRTLNDNINFNCNFGYADEGHGTRLRDTNNNMNSELQKLNDPGQDMVLEAYESETLWEQQMNSKSLASKWKLGLKKLFSGLSCLKYLHRLPVKYRRFDHLDTADAP
ncbi:unnamed protein product [Lymnaea stagnalis]|uniref:Uncharacterized protein n=1 Tax=Lymnaea stagnalis TaxID=6523 RepID=A0AAV2HV83_LYMST